MEPSGSGISIHAPAKGATKNDITNLGGYLISIHAPAKGATLFFYPRGFLLLFQSTLPRRERLNIDDDIRSAANFNPRSREGSDKPYDVYSPGAIIISIHAPAKGATSFNSFNLCALVDFNPRSREGSDIPYERLQTNIDDFNPRSREGSDTIFTTLLKKRYQFQSTLPRRERPDRQKMYQITGCISIHAPAKGATMIQLIRLTLAKFQSTLPRRERLICKNPKKSSARFQSTLPRRERRMMKGMLWLGFRFQSTLPRRERQIIMTGFPLN